jgi:two-component system sensor histidine kinase/response regulator
MGSIPMGSLGTVIEKDPSSEIIEGDDPGGLISSPQIMGSIAGGTVLLVEDNALNRQVATEILCHAGCRVEIAQNGREAIQVLHRTLDAMGKSRFDLILMDLQMPEMGGVEATRIIREDPRFVTLPIVAMTAHAMSGVREECLGVGMDDYVVKPIDPDVLFSVMALQMAKNPDARPSDTINCETSEPLSSGASHVSKRVIDDDTGTLSTLPGVDCQSALKRLCGNDMLLRKLLVEFFEDHSRTVIMLTDLINAGRWDEAKLDVHTLKGNAANLSMEDVADAAQTLESAILKEDASDCEELLMHLDGVLKQMLAGIERCCHGSDALDDRSESAAAAPMASPQKVLELLEEMAIEINENRPSALNRLKELKSALHGHGVNREIHALENALVRYDFSQAQSHFQTIRSDFV